MNHQIASVETDLCKTQTIKVNSIFENGQINAYVILPTRRSETTPLIAIHGISRNIEQMVEEFSTQAAEQGRTIILPEFSLKEWPVFQRVNRKIRPDRAILSLLATLRKLEIINTGPIDLFGYSGGGQLAHRFAMLYPELIGQLHIGAAGWYTLPKADLPYPLGLGPTTNGDTSWGRRMSTGLNGFLKHKITVYVGSEDVYAESTLLDNPLLNQSQGTNRVERARHYVNTLRQLQRDADLPSTATLVMMDDCGHSFLQCSQRAGLVSRVCAAST